MSAPRGALPRRAVLAGVVGVAAVAATPAAAADPDAKLLTLCRDFRRAEADLVRFMRATSDRWGARLPEHVTEAQAAMLDDQFGIRDALAELPAHTPAGRAAKAGVLWTMGGALCPPEPGEDDRLQWSLIRDVIAAGGGALPAGMIDGAEG